MEKIDLFLFKSNIFIWLMKCALTMFKHNYSVMERNQVSKHFWYIHHSYVYSSYPYIFHFTTDIIFVIKLCTLEILLNKLYKNMDCFNIIIINVNYCYKCCRPRHSSKKGKNIWPDSKNLNWISCIDCNLKYKLKLNETHMNLDTSECATHKHLIKKILKRWIIHMTQHSMMAGDKSKSNNKNEQFDLIHMENLVEQHECVVSEFDIFNKYITKTDGLLLLVHIGSINAKLEIYINT